MSQAATRESRLTDFVDLETLQALQDGFARATGIATSIRDSAGLPITLPAEEADFCSVMQSCPSGQTACQMSHAGASRLVAGEGSPAGPLLHECHAGLSQYVAPIIVGGEHLGAIIVGDRPRGPLGEDRLAALAQEFGLDQHVLGEAARRLPLWSDARMSSATAFVQQLANTIARLCYQSYQLRRRIDELAVVRDVAAALAEHTDLQEILDTATQQLVARMGLRAAALRLLDEDTGVLKMVSVANLSKEYLDKGQILAMDSPIDQNALAGQTVYIEDLRTDPRVFHKQKAREEGLFSGLVTGVSSGGKRLGVLRAYTGRRHVFSEYEVSLLEAIASQVATAIVNARLRRDMAQAEKVERQIKLAADVQRRMIPASPPSTPAYEFGCIYEPSSELGGDFYDFIRFDNGDVGLVISDVVGKGFPASLMMASVRSALRSHARRVTDITEIISSVNNRLEHDTLPHEFATAFYAELSADGTRMKYCNAGHEPMLLLRGGVVKELDVGGLALGIMEHAKYESAEVLLEPGDVLMTCTDGVLEALDYDGQAFGRPRLHQSLRLHGAMPSDVPIQMAAKQMLWDVRRFSGLVAPGDDLTLVMVRVREGAAGPSPKA